MSDPSQALQRMLKSSSARPLVMMPPSSEMRAVVGSDSDNAETIASGVIFSITS